MKVHIREGQESCANIKYPYARVLSLTSAKGGRPKKGLDPPRNQTSTTSKQKIFGRLKRETVMREIYWINFRDRRDVLLAVGIFG